MTYKNIAAIQASMSLHQRLTACAAEQHAPPAYTNWVDSRSWDFAAQPGWAEAWASALVANASVPEYDPGDDEGVITDEMILSATQVILQSNP